MAHYCTHLCLSINLIIFNIICWIAGSMGWSSHWPSIWCSKHYFFHDFLEHSKHFFCIHCVSTGASGAWHPGNFRTSHLTPSDFEVLCTNWHLGALFCTWIFKFLTQALTCLAEVGSENILMAPPFYIIIFQSIHFLISSKVFFNNQNYYCPKSRHALAKCSAL